MKVEADTASGVYVVSDFDKCEILTPAVFYDSLAKLKAGEVIGTDLDGLTAAKVIEEYGIFARAGGQILADAASLLGTKGGAATTDAKRAASATNGAKGGRPRYGIKLIDAGGAIISMACSRCEDEVRADNEDGYEIDDLDNDESGECFCCGAKISG
jgi:hypothetical protein